MRARPPNLWPNFDRMTHETILTAALVLLIAFAVDRLGHRWGIPSVVALIATGMVAKPLLASVGLTLSGLDAAVPVVGTIGLVLIVLEGAFDVEVSRDKSALALRAAISASLGLVAWTALLAVLSHHGLGLGWFDALVLSIPFAVISSAVAIPSSRSLSKTHRDFVTYESTLSDILGILLFFALVTSDGTLSDAAWTLISSSLWSLLLGGLAAASLLALLLKLEGHIRFMPLLAGMFALYAVGKLTHLSPLLMVMLFGLTLNNPHLVSWIKPFEHMLNAQAERGTVEEFKTLTRELTFAVRAFFFVLLGYWTDLATFGNWRAWLSAVIALLSIYGARWTCLKLLRIQPHVALTWLAPRGLITVLLYLTARPLLSLPAYIDGTVMLVVLCSVMLTSLSTRRPSGKQWTSQATP